MLSEVAVTDRAAMGTLTIDDGRRRKRLSVLLLLGAIGGLPYGCDRTERTDLFSCLAPGEARTAIFYSRIGGGAAGTVGHVVSVRPVSDGKETIVFSMSGGYDAVLKWQSDDHLLIEFPSEAQTIYGERRYVKRLADGGELRVDLLEKESQNGQFVDVRKRCWSAPAEEG